MKAFQFFWFVLLAASVHAQIIVTVCGNGTSSNTGIGGPATAATINYPVGGAFDKFGNYYFGLGSQGCAVDEISTSGIITTVAGIVGNCGDGGDGGPATLALMNNVQNINFDNAGNLLIVEGDFGDRIRKVNMSTGIISTIAGTNANGYNGDNIPATAAELFNPVDVCVDKIGNIYIADAANNRVRKVDTTGIITTFAGNGTPLYGGDGVPATSVGIGAYSVCFDNSGNLLIGDWYARVFKVNTSGIMSYFAGNGISTSGYTGDGGPATAAEIVPYNIRMDKYNNLFIVDYTLNHVRMINSAGYISTIAGTDIRGYNGDSIAATSAWLHDPVGLAIDECDNIYVTDLGNYRVREIIYPHCDYLSVSNIKHETSLNIYPNPAYDVLNIDNLQTPTLYNMVSVIGTTVQEGMLKEGSNSISVKELPPSMYTLEIVGADGEKVVRKIIKE